MQDLMERLENRPRWSIYQDRRVVHYEPDSGGYSGSISDLTQGMLTAIKLTTTDNRRSVIKFFGEDDLDAAVSWVENKESN